MNSSFYKKLLFIFLVGICYTLNTLACRFTVREIGFSDIGSIPYILYIYTKSDLSGKDISTIKKFSYAFLYETNIKIEIVNIYEEKDSIKLSYPDKHNIHTFPSAVFVSPEGESVICPLHYATQNFDKTLLLLLENLVTSGIRNSVIDQLLRSYCVVLVTEGKNTSKNNDVIKMAKEAIGEISDVMVHMPKVVNTPPRMIVIPHEKIHEERILLMSMGILNGRENKPFVTVIYGRGRIIGPVLKGEQITKRKLFNLLTVVGADCECGLDQSWVLGRMIPMRWESAVQSKLVHLLGFDVESPLIKAEMSQILSLSQIPENSLDPLENNLLEYTEKRVDVKKKSDDITKISAYDIHKSFSQPASKRKGVVTTIIFVIGGILLFVIVAAVILFMKHKRK